MELMSELAPYYIRKKQIEISLKLPNEATSVVCCVLDNNGIDITNEPGVLYSKMNVLKVRKDINSDRCKLCLFFQRARYRVTLKFIAIGVNKNIIDDKYCSFRVYSEEPRMKRKANVSSSSSSSSPSSSSSVERSTVSKRPRLNENDMWFSELNDNNSPASNTNNNENVFNFDFLSGGEDLPFDYDDNEELSLSNNNNNRNRNNQDSISTIIGVPRLPLPLVNVLHKKEIEYAVKSLIDTNDNSTSTHGIGITGMTGIGKTVALARIARDQRIMEKFTGGVYWISFTSNIIDAYQLVVELGKKNNIEVENTNASCQRAIEKLILQSGDSTLIIFDNVQSKKQIRDIQTEINRTSTSKIMVGTSHCGILSQSSLENISLHIPSKYESMLFIKTIASKVSGDDKTSKKYDGTTTALSLSSNSSSSSSESKQEKENKYIAGIASAVGRLPLAMETAARCRTMVFGYEEILSSFKSDVIFSEKGHLDVFSMELRKKILMLDNVNKKLALFSLAAISNNQMKYEEPYYMVPTNLLNRLWSVSETTMRICFQALLDMGLVGYQEIIVNTNTDNNVRKKENKSFLLLHILTARYLNIIQKYFNKKYTNNGNQSFTNNNNDTLTNIDNNNNDIKMLNNSGDDFNFKNMFQQFSLLELYFYVDTNSLQVLYNILMETSSHEKPMKEFYRRRNEIPEEIGTLYPFMGSTLVDPYQNDGNSNNVVIGLNNAVKKVKEEIEAEKQALIDAGMKKEAKMWMYNTEVLEKLGKTYDNLIESMFNRLTKSRQMDKPMNLREYDVSKCMTWLKIWHEFGNICVGKEFNDIDDVLNYEKLFGAYRFMKPDGTSVICFLDRLVDLSVLENGTFTRENLMRAVWFEAHHMLFDCYLSNNVVEHYWELDVATKYVKVIEGVKASTEDIIMMEKLLMGCYAGGNARSYLYTKNEAELLFYDGLTVQFTSVFEDVNVKVIHSKKEWDNVINTNLNKSFVSNSIYWRRVLGNATKK